MNPFLIVCVSPRGFMALPSLWYIVLFQQPLGFSLAPLFFFLYLWISHLALFCLTIGQISFLTNQW